MGAILAGGASSRMGRDKALVTVDGMAMATRVARALEAAGADRVVLVGAKADVAERLGLANVEDRWSGAGPLGGLATALLDAADQTRTSGADPTRVAVVVAGCDQPDLTGDLLAGLVGALGRAGPGILGAVPVTPDGRRQPLPSAWRPAAAPRLGAAMERGERRADAAFGAAGVVEVAVSGAEVADLDTPEQVAAREGTDP